MKIKDRIQPILAWFIKHQPDAATELDYKNPYELLVAVILSAQCTDKRVNVVTPELFKRYPNVKDLASSTADDIYPYIRSVSYPGSKAKHLHGMAVMVMDKFNGRLPETVDLLQELPGVGRKTANVVASVVFDIPAMPVDTHVFRVSARLGLTKGARNPLMAEKQLVKCIPKDLLSVAHHWLILHGRYICVARKPKCSDCGISEFCLFFEKKQKAAEKKLLKN